MKKTLISIALLATFTLSNCTTKEETAAIQLENASEKFDDVNKEYLVQMETFRAESNAKIEENNQRIVDFNLRIEKEKKELKAEYQKKIKELEAKNTDLKKRLDDFKADGNENWESFKKEFNHDMEALGEAFSNLTVSNTKK